jgi:hypothetical protein
MGQTISERLEYLRHRDSWRAGCVERCTSRFGGEGLVFLGNQDPASYPTAVIGAEEMEMGNQSTGTESVVSIALASPNAREKHTRSFSHTTMTQAGAPQRGNPNPPPHMQGPIKGSC